MSENMIHLTINHMPVEVPAGTRIIEAAHSIGIDIPHLCYHPDQSIKAHCRMCMVEVTGQRKLLAACSTLVWEGMEVITDSKRVYDAQVGVLDLILADHHQDCLACARNNNCSAKPVPALQPSQARPARRLQQGAAPVGQPHHRSGPHQVRQVRPLREGLYGGPGHRRPLLHRPQRRVQGDHRL